VLGLIALLAGPLLTGLATLLARPLLGLRLPALLAAPLLALAHRFPPVEYEFSPPASLAVEWLEYMARSPVRSRRSAGAFATKP
jgi:hypothetical protein